MDSDGRNYQNPSSQQETAVDSLCASCHQMIYDRHIWRVDNSSWHLRCLKCHSCNKSLKDSASCFYKNNRLYCKSDYFKEFGVKCSRCTRSISSDDWVRRAKDNVYHIACFACDDCKRQLSTGEEFVLKNNRLLCRSHYIEQDDIKLTDETKKNLNESDSKDSADSETNDSYKYKRMRTTFSDNQLQVLHTHFSLDCNPDGNTLEKIAQVTGLPKRVAQVWFQNSRARYKKDVDDDMGDEDAL